MARTATSCVSFSTDASLNDDQDKQHQPNQSWHAVSNAPMNAALEIDSTLRKVINAGKLSQIVEQLRNTQLHRSIDSIIWRHKSR